MGKNTAMMTPSGNEGWASRLARALARLAAVHQDYRHEIDDYRRAIEQKDRWERETFWYPSEALQYFYSSSCRADSKHSEKRYSSLSSAVREVEQVIGQNPALEGVLGSAGDNEFGVRILDRRTYVSRRAMVAGLMTRAKQVEENGFRVASCELKELLDLSLNDASASASGNLNEGCHISAFIGLRFEKPFKITEGMTIVPFEQVDTFVNRNMMARILPAGSEWKMWKSVSAIVRRFRWQPTLLSLDEMMDADVGWERPDYMRTSAFFKDAGAFIELLAVFHGVPVASLMNFPLCAGRRISLLLGNPYFHLDWSLRSWPPAFVALRKPHPVDIDMVDKVRQIFLERERRRKYAPVISRLAEALARSGQYSAEDKILDVAIALERMYKPNSPEVTYKLRTRAACFLEPDTEGRKRVFEEIKRFYAARSEIVHRNQPSAEKMKDAFKTGFVLARRSLVKLLQEDPSADWNGVVLRR